MSKLNAEKEKDARLKGCNEQIIKAEFEKENEDPGEGYLQKLEERLLQGDK